ncbi:hypothetical protein [Streptomyces sp. NPDC056543]|uniref:hypothetical protein n=1 Tax=unclassified Streptomyces TaxID=2593676 RepID=UPI0036AF57EF
MPVPDARAELQISGTWTDVTDYAAQSAGIQLSRGRSDEGRTVDPGAGSLTLLSPDGRFSNRNPNSPYFGLLPRNTPARVSVAGATPALYVPEGVAGRATTPDTAALDITGDIDIRVDLAPVLWKGAGIGYELIAKHVTTGNQRSWRLMVTGEGQLLLAWSTAGTSDVEQRSPVIPLLRQRQAVRATLDVNNGAGGYTVTFYVAPSLAGPWTQFGQTVTTSGTTSIFSSTAIMEVGDNATVGFTRHERRIYAAEVRDGIDGTIVANPDFAAQTVGATSFADSTGKTWTVTNGAAISDRVTRATQAVPTWPASWHVSGHDQRASLQTAGILRRLGQGKKALQSTLRRRIPAYSPLAYWPMEDGSAATQASSAVTGAGPLSVTGFTFAQDSTLDGSSALPTVDAGATMRGTVPAPAGATTSWAVVMLYRTDSPPASDQEWITFRTSGTLRRWRLLMGTTDSHLQGYDSDGTLVLNSALGLDATEFDGWQRLEMRAQQNGGNIDYSLEWTKVGGTGGVINGSVAGTVGVVSQIDTRIGTVSDLRLGHLAVFSDIPASGTAYDDADFGFAGETARERLLRLADEESSTIALAVHDGDLTRETELVGPQRPTTLLDLLQETADADGGILYEDPLRQGLVYRTRSSMQNQPVRLTVDYGQLGPPFEPTENDLNLRNDVTVSRDNGSSGRVVLDDGPLSVDEIGVYDEAVSLNLHNDTQPVQHAGWRLHLSSWDEARYPTVRIMLHKYPQLIPQVAALEIGDRIQIINTPSWMPPGPVDLIVQRIEDDLRTLTWDVALTCSPAGPWTVGEFDDLTLGRADTDGSELINAVTDTDTVLPVKATAGPAWVQDPAEMPFDIKLGGEEATVTAVTGVAQDLFTRSVSNGWGTADSGQAWATAGGSASNFSVNGSVGQHSITTLNAPRATTISVVSPDVDVTMDFALSVVPTGDNVFIQSLARRVDSSNFYNARVQIAAGGAMTLSIRKTVAGVDSQLATFATGLTYVATTLYRLRFTVSGTSLSASLWLASGTPPPTPHAAATDSSFTAAGGVGLRTQAGASLTNVLPVTVSADNLSSTPQLMTVTRSANGIVKAHAAGTDVRLAQPMTVAL